VKRDGLVLAMDGRLVFDHGAYLVSFPTPIMGAVIRTMLPSAYRIEHLRFEQVNILTSKAAWGPFRGPWGVESLAREMLLDEVARTLGLDPTEVRRRNLVSLAEQPRKMVTGPTLEGFHGLEAFDCALETIGYDKLRRDQATARDPGRLLGIGHCAYTEAAPGPPDYVTSLGVPGLPAEYAAARLEPDGGLTVYTSQSPHGQGHETTLAQVAADEFTVPLEKVRVVWGDTRSAPFGPFGTGGSRAATMASGGVLHAVRTVKGKALKLAGDLLEIAPEDLEMSDGMVVPRGSPASAMPLAQVAAMSYFMTPEGEEPGLRSVAGYRGGPGGWSGGTHACLVEVDPETGIVQILRYVVAEDCGKLINPAIVEGQIRGGVAQGIGAALLEDGAYEEDGNFASSTYVNYLLPLSTNVPPIEIVHVEGGPMHEVDYRGVGEGGTIAALPAVANAVADAIGGLSAAELPLTPNRVLDLLDARSR
jgi:carbon-monoxide dehydrogenase large subunit